MTDHMQTDNSVVQRSDKQNRSLIITSWVLITLTCLVAIIPFLGFASWLVAAPILFITLIMGVIVLSRGGTLPGLFILLTSLIAAPIFIFVAPFISSTLGLVGGTAAVASGAAAAQQASKSVASSPPQSQPDQSPVVEEPVGPQSIAAPSEPTVATVEAPAASPPLPAPQETVDDTAQLFARAQEADRRLGSVYGSLRSHLIPSGVARLKEEQLQWLKFRAQQTGSDEVLAQGSSANPAALRRFTELNEQRASQLEMVLQSSAKLEVPQASNLPPSNLVASPARLPSKSWDRPHIYLYIANGSQRKAATELRRQLLKAGNTVVSIEVASGNPGIPTDSSEIRFFTPGDSAEAQKIAQEFRPFFGTTGVYADLPDGMPYVSHARQYEIWFSKAFR